MKLCIKVLTIDYYLFDVPSFAGFFKIDDFLKMYSILNYEKYYRYLVIENLIFLEI